MSEFGDFSIQTKKNNFSGCSCRLSHHAEKDCQAGRKPDRCQRYILHPFALISVAVFCYFVHQLSSPPPKKTTNTYLGNAFVGIKQIVGNKIN